MWMLHLWAINCSWVQLGAKLSARSKFGAWDDKGGGARRSCRPWRVRYSYLERCIGPWRWRENRTAGNHRRRDTQSMVPEAGHSIQRRRKASTQRRNISTAAARSAGNRRCGSRGTQSMVPEAGSSTRRRSMVDSLATQLNITAGHLRGGDGREASNGVVFWSDWVCH